MMFFQLSLSQTLRPVTVGHCPPYFLPQLCSECFLICFSSNSRGLAPLHYVFNCWVVFFLVNQSPSGFVNIQELSGPSVLSEVGTGCVILRHDLVQFHDKEEINFINEYWLLSIVEDFHTLIC